MMAMISYDVNGDVDDDVAAERELRHRKSRFLRDVSMRRGEGKHTIGQT